MNDSIDSQNLKEKTAQGLFWGFLSSGGMQLLNLIIGIFLARLLSPEEYGIVGMLAIFTLLANNLQESGFGVALVNIKDIKHNDYNSVFWFNVGMSVVLYLILFLCAPYIAAFFHQPCLIPLSRFVFLAFIFSSLGIAPNAMLVRNLKMKEKAITSLSALLVSGTVAVIMALKGFSYWSLATQQVLYSAVIIVGRYYYTHWCPTFKVDFAPVKCMFSFSYKVLITSILTTINNNVLTVIFGRLFPAQAVGNYTQANKWNTMANQLVTNTVSQVAQPVLTRVTDDNERQCRLSFLGRSVGEFVSRGLLRRGFGGLSCHVRFGNHCAAGHSSRHRRQVGQQYSPVADSVHQRCFHSPLYRLSEPVPESRQV